MKIPGVIFLTTALLCLGAAVYVVSDFHQYGVAYKLRALTGARTRVTWCSQADSDGRDVGAETSRLILMGLDTDDRRGIHPILNQISNYRKPLITPKGDRIVYTDFPHVRIRVVNWDGTGHRTLADGLALDVWQDPVTRSEWVYALDVKKLDENDAGRPVVRFLLDNPLVKEPVWEVTPVNPDTFQLCENGTRAVSLFPWPLVGIACLTNSTWQETGRGCWPGMAPDNSSLTWIFDGAHRNLFFHSPLHNREWKVRINDAPGVDGYEVYHPRWANRFRFLAMTGPYKSGEGDNRIRAGGKGVEIYAGRFDPTLTRVEQWVRVTRNQAADFFPDIWIDPSGATASTGVSSAMSDASILPPEDVAARSLIVEARLLETTAIPSPKSIAPYRNALVIYRYKPERIIRGTYQKSSLDVAHWGLRDGQAQPLRRKKGDLYQLILELLDSRKDLKGERVVMDFPDSGQPIYIEVNP